MSEILTHALPGMQHVNHGRFDLSGTCQKFEIPMDARGQIQHTTHERFPLENEGDAKSASSADHGTCADSYTNSKAASVSASGATARISSTCSHEEPRSISSGGMGSTCTSLSAAIPRTMWGSCTLN